MASQVLLVDDHKIMRDGIKAILRHSDDFTVMAEAETGTEAVQICKLKRPDIILMDIGLPGLNGIETTTEILEEFFRIRRKKYFDRKAFLEGMLQAQSGRLSNQVH